jgi:hypothetical protein
MQEVASYQYVADNLRIQHAISRDAEPNAFCSSNYAVEVLDGPANSGGHVSHYVRQS